MPRYLLAFESTHAAMAANKALSAAAPVMLATPRAITAGCGMSLRFEAEGTPAAIALAASVPDARGLSALYAEQAGEYRLLQRM